jgi:hypothetical protein
MPTDSGSGPKGSLGFYSATKCHGTLRTAGVATNHDCSWSPAQRFSAVTTR